MATKLKSLITNNPKLKIISLALMFIFISTCFETLFNLRFNFSANEMYDFVRIPKFYFFGSVVNVFTADILDDYQLIAIITAILSLISFILYKSNRKCHTHIGKLIINKVSKVPLEFIVFVILFVIFIRFNIWSNALRFYDNMLILSDTLILILFYTLVESIKININNIGSKMIVYQMIKDFLDKQNKKSINKKIALILLLALVFQFILLFIFFQYFMYRFGWSLISAVFLSIFSIVAFSYIYHILSSKFKYIEYISKNIKNIENGDLKYKLEIKGKDEISNLAASINNITNGLESALENQIKSEKMKTELITNVSHDLKTPLTSIVNYVDILKNNELDPDTVKDYINILDKKSKRLKVLIEDIFEASKISSGDIELNIEKTDVKELLIQSIVELEDKINDSRLDFIVDTPDDPIYTMIDGKRTWRVFENLIGNILKYSLSGTRVYIDILTENDDITIIFKNISNHKLNMQPDELLTRFRRGDVSRNTEGSGLGLSIAQNLIELQNATMKLDIDGDLFKITLKFKQVY